MIACLCLWFSFISKIGSRTAVLRPSKHRFAAIISSRFSESLAGDITRLLNHTTPHSQQKVQQLPPSIPAGYVLTLGGAGYCFGQGECWQGLELDYENLYEFMYPPPCQYICHIYMRNTENNITPLLSMGQLCTVICIFILITFVFINLHK